MKMLWWFLTCILIGIVLGRGLVALHHTADEVAVDPNTLIGTRAPNTWALQRYHDPELPVTCWIVEVDRGGGISCLPDAQLEHKP